MRSSHWVLLVGFGLVIAGGSAACSADGTSSSAAGGTGNLGGMGATGGGGSGGSSGGAGGGGAIGGAAGSGGAATGGSAGSGGGGAGDAGTDGGGSPADHLVISEIGIEPGAAEFIELYNPTGAEVDLSNYYLADNSAYHKLTSGPWNPQGTAGTDFLVRFPAGAKLAAGAVLVVVPENATGNPTFEATFGKCPTYTLNAKGAALSCASKSVPAMTIPANGSVGDKAGTLLTNDREMVVLFRWDGAATKVEDVDYVTWGTNFDDNTRIDKSGVAGYKPDTARTAQKPANPGMAGDGGASLAIERCALDKSEKLSGGNGVTGHDETSEDLGSSFKSTAAPSPGTKNTCL